MQNNFFGQRPGQVDINGVANIFFRANAANLPMLDKES